MLLLLLLIPKARCARLSLLHLICPLARSAVFCAQTKRRRKAMASGSVDLASESGAERLVVLATALAPS